MGLRKDGDEKGCEMRWLVVEIKVEGNRESLHRIEEECICM